MFLTTDVLTPTPRHAPREPEHRAGVAGDHLFGGTERPTLRPDDATEIAYAIVAWALAHIREPGPRSVGPCDSATR